MKSTLLSCSIAVTLLTVCCLSNAFDWEKYSNGELIKSELIFSDPINVVFGTINDGFIETRQYMMAAKIRAYKLLYMFVGYCKFRLPFDSSNEMRILISASTSYVIKFMKHHNTDISDLETLLDDTILNSENADYTLLNSLQKFENGVYELLFNDVTIFNMTVLGVTPARHFEKSLELAIRWWTFFNNSEDEEILKTYIPARYSYERDTSEAVNYFYNKIIKEHLIEQKKKEEEEGNEINALEYDIVNAYRREKKRQKREKKN